MVNKKNLRNIIVVFSIILIASIYWVMNSNSNNIEVETAGLISETATKEVSTSVPIETEETEATEEMVETEVIETATVEVQVTEDLFDPSLVYIPEILRIPSLGIEADIFSVELEKVVVGGINYYQWGTLDDDVAWHITSATLGLPGNTVFSGHHNAGAMVFKDLASLEIGTIIIIESQGVEFEYEIVESLILPEFTETVEVRLENAKRMEETDDERLTLITCWPADSNTHRVFVTAMPIE